MSTSAKGATLSEGEVKPPNVDTDPRVFVSKVRYKNAEGKTVVATRQFVSSERAAKKKVMAMAGLKTGKQFRKFLQKARANKRKLLEQGGEQ